ncbi:MAG TPA: hypothetical protein VFC10_14755 [Terriglobia bacterium]|nr:hypothetical protein [Terriglobia bacterium]
MHDTVLLGAGLDCSIPNDLANGAEGSWKLRLFSLGPRSPNCRRIFQNVIAEDTLMQFQVEEYIQLHQDGDAGDQQAGWRTTTEAPIHCETHKDHQPSNYQIFSALYIPVGRSMKERAPSACHGGTDARQCIRNQDKTTRSISILDEHCCVDWYVLTIIIRLSQK